MWRHMAPLGIVTVCLSCSQAPTSSARGGQPEMSRGQPQREAPVPVESDFGSKIVYAANPDVPVERLRADCAARGGTFNTCGTPCAPDAEACAQVCRMTCTALAGAGTGGTEKNAAKWQIYSRDLFTLRHPPDARIDREGPGLTRFRVIGPESEPNTEITDGFTFMIGPRGLPPGQDAEAFAEAQLQEISRAGDVLAPVTQTTVAGRTAYQYRTRIVADTTHLVVPIDRRQVLTIAWSVSGERTPAYRHTIDRMLESLRIEMDESVQVALLDPEQERQGTQLGCDTVVAVPRRPGSGDNLAEAALRALFAINETSVGGLYNFIARTNDTLHLENVEVVDGRARVHLSGRVSSYAGVCDHPRARIQIEQTALRAPGVEQVMILLNGEVSDLEPDARGGGNRR